ncbi:hypothetical protein F4861DRAFT_272983 [Xylaria intraflava]|nr:hypothetical protein F4861DRAFT_272983 [Xylaria intraflava]
MSVSLPPFFCFVFAIPRHTPTRAVAQHQTPIHPQTRHPRYNKALSSQAKMMRNLHPTEQYQSSQREGTQENPRPADHLRLSIVPCTRTSPAWGGTAHYLTAPPPGQAPGTYAVQPAYVMPQTGYTPAPGYYYVAGAPGSYYYQPQ